MVRRKLEALNYSERNSFDVNDEKQFRSLVLWLEDQKIRHYLIEDRQGLRDLKSDEWSKSFEKYCSDLEVPISNNTNTERLEWILGFAVRLEYQDEVDKFKNCTSESVKNKKTAEPLVKSSNPLDNLDFHSEEFKNGLKNLAHLLKVSPHPDPLVTVEAICKVVLNNINNKLANKNPKATEFPILEGDLGFDLGDYILNQAAKILRLLYIHDLRDLQTKINECIVAVQTITANPKTDTKLGKVGF